MYGDLWYTILLTDTFTCRLALHFLIKTLAVVFYAIGTFALTKAGYWFFVEIFCCFRPKNEEKIGENLIICFYEVFSYILEFFLFSSKMRFDTQWSREKRLKRMRKMANFSFYNNLRVRLLCQKQDNADSNATK